MSPLTGWISASSLKLFDRRRAMLAYSSSREVHRNHSQQLTQSLHNDREPWWSQRASEMETAVLAGNFSNHIQIIRTTGHRKVGALEAHKFT